MLYVGLKHTHLLFVCIYLAVFLYKLYILLTKDKAAVDSIRQKTKLVEMIVPTVFLVTGIWMAVISHNGQEGWLYFKLGLMVIAILCGVIAMKKYNKMMGILAFILFLLIYGISESKKMRKVLNFESEASERIEPIAKDYNKTKHGETLYKSNGVMNCINCHGEKGDAGLTGAANLITSKSLLLLSSNKANFLCQLMMAN
ncbi:MAG: SirB2 family protein [Bacteroidetes bacterium]|nr:SirB2 family protein [Bacteroidota bacterium]